MNDALMTITNPGETVLVFGSTGWIGSRMVALFSAMPNVRVVCAKARIENLPDVCAEITESGAQYVVNAAGVVGFPNVNAIENRKQETLLTNVVGSINVAEACARVSRMREGPPIHLTYFGSGCIFDYDDDHPAGSGKGFTESDTPNFTGSFYVLTKHTADAFIQEYDNVLNLRLRLPSSSEVHPKNMLIKLAGYKRLINIPNSFCDLDDLLPIAVDMTMRRVSGTFNFVNPGVISHNEILTLYRQYVDPNITWENITLDDHDEMLKVKRCNVHLDVGKLQALYPDLPDIKTSVERDMRILGAKLRPSS